MGEFILNWPVKRLTPSDKVIRQQDVTRFTSQALRYYYKIENPKVSKAICRLAEMALHVAQEGDASQPREGQVLKDLQPVKLSGAELLEAQQRGIDFYIASRAVAGETLTPEQRTPQVEEILQKRDEYYRPRRAKKEKPPFGDAMRRSLDLFFQERDERLGKL